MIKKISIRWFLWFSLVAGYAIILGALLYFNMFKYAFDANLQGQIIDTVRRNASMLIDGLVSQQSHFTIQENDIITGWMRQDDRILSVIYFNNAGKIRWHKDIGMIGRSLEEYDKAGHLETDAIYEAFTQGRPRVKMKGDGTMYEIAIPLKAKDTIAGVISIDVSREQVKAEINKALLSYLAGALVIFALMGIVLYLFVIRNVVNPIVNLTDSIDNISTKSFQMDFVERDDEVGALAKSIDHFLGKVKRELEEREIVDRNRQNYEQEWWSSVLAITIPKGSRAIVVDENNNVMHANFELSIQKEGPIHLLDIFGGTQQDIVHLVGQAMDNPGKIFRAKTESGGRSFGIKTLQLSSKGGIVRTVIVLEPLS